jgi:hypothetical protein
VLAVALAVSFAVAGVASAADAPKTTTSSSTFFLRQEGCGTTAEAGRLEPKASADGATGCGTIGGLPVDELAHQAGESLSEDFATVGKGLPVKLDAARKVTGQLAAGSWFGEGVGAGEVTFDVALRVTTVAGTGISFGETSVTGSITPGENVATVPFSYPVPAAAAGAKVKSVVLTVAQRGANLGYSAKQLDGDSYLVLPTKK